MLEAPPQAPFQEDVSAPAPIHNLPHVLLDLLTQNLVVPGGQVSFHDLSRVSSQCSVCAVSASTVAKPETGPVEASALVAFGHLPSGHVRHLRPVLRFLYRLPLHCRLWACLSGSRWSLPPLQRSRGACRGLNGGIRALHEQCKRSKEKSKYTNKEFNASAVTACAGRTPTVH
jgi:hypothetical protein